jgi:hypothetical protein
VAGTFKIGRIQRREFCALSARDESGILERRRSRVLVRQCVEKTNLATLMLVKIRNISPKT